MTKNMVMIAKGFVGETQTDLKFSQATAMVRVSLTNAKAESMNVSSVSVTSPGAFGLAGEYNTADGTVSLTGTAADVMTQEFSGLTIAGGSAVDFYFLALPGTGIGDFEIAVNDEKVTVPASEFADKGIEKLEAGNRYWFQLVEGNNGMMRKATVGEGIITNLPLINAIEASQGIDFSRNEDGFVVVQDNKEIIDNIKYLTLNAINAPTLTELTGIEYFVNLEKISLADAQIQIADFSSNKNLITIQIRRCAKLTSVNLEGLVNLINLQVEDGSLENINLTPAVNLGAILLRNNKLTEIDLKSLKKLGSVYLDGNMLTGIDVSQNPELGVLSLVGRDMSFTELNVKDNPKLQYLSFGANGNGNPWPIEEIDLSNNLELEQLYICSCPNLKPEFDHLKNLKDLLLYNLDRYTSFDASPFTELEQLRVWYCKNVEAVNVRNNPNLVALDIEGCSPIKDIDVSKNSLLVSLNCNYTSVSTLDISMLENLKALYCQGCYIPELDITKNTALKNIQCGDQKDPETGQYIEMVLYMAPEQKEMWLDQEAYSNHVRVEVITE